VAGDVVGLMEALGIDRADVSSGGMGGIIAQQDGIGSHPEIFLPPDGPFRS